MSRSQPAVAGVQGAQGIEAQGIELITGEAELSALIDRWARAPRLALDVEANGLFVYRPQLCALQLAWEEDGQQHIAVVDTLAVPVEPLGDVLGAEGPLKILHDFTFDATMLAEHGVTLGHVQDTSVAARFLGEQETGLASLARNHLQVVLSKKLQSHNWAERPFTEEQLAYLASDVAHLFALRDGLWQRAEEAAIVEEIALECAYKLHSAQQPRASKPAYTRIKGYSKLSDERRAVVRSLHAARERLAEKLNKPPHYIASNRLLMDIAGAKLQNPKAIKRKLSGQRSFRRNAALWLQAVRNALDGQAPEEIVPAPPAPMSRAEIALRKRLNTTLSKWRRKEAEQRGVDMQVVVPGHCMGPLAGKLVALSEDADATPQLLDIAGFGEVRRDRYSSALFDLGRRVAEAERARQLRRQEALEPDPRPE